MLTSLLLILILPALGSNQTNTPPDVWKPLTFFVGTWDGTAKGRPGNSTIEREYQFVSESIENIGAGWRARETYTIVNANEFSETFELAAPGKDFEVYTESHFKRKK